MSTESLEGPTRQTTDLSMLSTEEKTLFLEYSKENPEKAKSFLEEKGFPNPAFTLHDFNNLATKKEQIPPTETGKFLREYIEEKEEGILGVEEPKYVNLTKLLEEVLEIFKYKQKGYQFNLTIDGIEDPHILGLENALFFVFFNLLSNAVKYHVEDTDIEILVSKGDGVIKISVSNESEKIPENFDPFKRGSRAHQEQNGTGIGLASVAKTTQKHRGKTHWKQETNTEGKNIISFTVQFPFIEGIEKNPSVIIIDDQEIIRSIITSILNNDGILCDSLNHKDPDFKQQLKESKEYDIAFVDFEEGKGIEIIEALKKKVRYFFIVSGVAENEEKKESYGEMYSKWIEKPFNVVEISQVIEAFKARNNK